MKDYHIWADILTAIYRRTGDRPFTHAKISDILPPGHIIRYVSRGYFLRVRDSDGTLAQGGARNRAAVWRWHPRAADLRRSSIAHQDADHRWENLARGLTGGDRG